MPTRSELEARLEQLVESDGDAEEIASLIHQIDSLADDDQLDLASSVEHNTDVVIQEDSMSNTVSAEDLGITPEASPESTPTQSAGITKEALGIGGGFSSALKSLDLNTIKSYLIAVEDAEDLMILASPGYSQIDGAHRIHVDRKGEILRASRGFGIFAAGGVSAGTVTSPNGNIHIVEDGICYEKQLTDQVDSFNGSVTPIARTTECKGHLDYKNVGSSDEPKFEATGREWTRCQHSWALMFDAGYFISFSKKFFEDTVWVEIAQRVGDEDAREAAEAQIQVWRDKRENKFETRKAFAQAINHAKNVMNLPEGSRLPDVPEVLEYKLPDGRSLREAILDLKGTAFVVEFQVPVNGELVTQRLRALNLNEIRSRMAPAFALAKTQGAALNIVGVSPAA